MTPPPRQISEERIQDIRDAFSGRLTYLNINQYRLSNNDEQMRDLLSALDQRTDRLKEAEGLLNETRVLVSEGQCFTLLEKIDAFLSSKEDE